VLLSSFGDSAVKFNIRIWIENPWRAERRHAMLNDTIWWGLKKAGIVIAFPKLDVHFDEPLTKSAGLEQAHMEERKNE
jgi:small-conductance mechanosensitive channel